MSTYTVFAYDKNYNRFGTLPASNLSFGSVLNGSGSISFSLTPPYFDTVGNNTPTNAQLEAWTAPSKTLLFVDRDGILVWGGILWTRNRKQNRVWDITGQEFLSYFNLRVVPQSVANPSGNYVGAFEFAALMAQMLTDAQSVMEAGMSGDIGIVVPSAPSSGSFVANYLYNQFQMISNVISDMTSSQDVECYVDVAWAAGVPTPTLVMGSPICGVPVSTSGLTVNLANAVGAGYEWQEDGTAQGIKVIEIGSLPSGGSQIQAASANVAAESGDYPLIEKVISRPYALSQDLLDSDAQSDAALFGFPAEVVTVPIRSDDSPGTPKITALGSFNPGDEIRAMCEPDDQFTAGVDEMLRIVAYTTSVPDGPGPAITTLTLNDIPSIAPSTWYDADHPPAHGPPGAPTALTATPVGSPEVDLAWTAPAGAVLGYYVYENGGTTPIATVLSGTAYNVIALLEATAYTFQVAAYNFAGPGPQATVSITTPAGTPPGTPTGLTAGSPTGSTIDLAWTASSGSPTGYYIYRGASLVATVAGTSHTDTGLASGTAYTYTVAAYSSGGTSAHSSSASATTTGSPPASTLFGFNGDASNWASVLADLGISYMTAGKYFANPGMPASFGDALKSTLHGGTTLQSGVTMPVLCLKPHLPLSSGDQATLATIAGQAASAAATPYITLWQEGEHSGYTPAQLKTAHALACTIVRGAGAKYCQVLMSYTASGKSSKGPFSQWVATDAGGGPLDLYGIDAYCSAKTDTAIQELDKVLAQMAVVFPSTPYNIGITELNSTSGLPGAGWTGVRAQWFKDAWTWCQTNSALCYICYFNAPHNLPWPPDAGTIAELHDIAVASGI